MIKVNLVSKAQLKRIKSGVAASAETTFDENVLDRKSLVNLAIILAFPLSLYLYETQTIPAKEADIAAKQVLLGQLTATNQKAQAAVTEIKKFKIDQARIQSQIGALESLKKGRAQEVKVLDTIQKSIPTKVWLEDISIQDPMIVLKGLSATDQGLTGFMDALSRSIFLRDVSLIKSEQYEGPGAIQAKKFEISCALEKVQ